jgi:hypothetical protein
LPTDAAWLVIAERLEPDVRPCGGADLLVDRLRNQGRGTLTALSALRGRPEPLNITLCRRYLCPLRRPAAGVVTPPVR